MKFQFFRKEKVLVVAAVVVLGVLGSFWWFRFRMRRPSVGDLELSISLEEDTFWLGAPVGCQVILRNAGRKKLLVNKRMAVNSEYAPEKLGEITFNLVGPDGQKKTFLSKVNINEPQAKDFGSLDSGEEFFKVFEINQDYDLSQPGEYEIQAVYESQSEVKSFGNLAKAWKGRLESNLLRFKIEENQNK